MGGILKIRTYSAFVGTLCLLCNTAIAAEHLAFERSRLPSIYLSDSIDIEKVTIMVDDKLFEQVPLGTSKQTECSPPEPDVSSRGVAIRAPSRVSLPSNDSKQSTLIIPLCGVYFVDVLTAFQKPGGMVLIIKNGITGEIHRAHVLERDPSSKALPPSRPPLDPSKYANQAFGSFFNINVTSYLELPPVPALYHIKVEFCGYQSNEVTVAVVGHL